MEQRVIFLDIDGTLTMPGSNEPPQSAVWAVEQARKAGHYVFLCTGRNYDMLSPLLKYDFDGVVASSGGYIICCGSVIYDCPMTKAQSLAALETLKKNGVYMTIECKDGSYTDEGFKEFLGRRSGEGESSELVRWREQLERELNIRPMSEYRDEPIYKIVVMSPSMEQLDEPQKVLENDFAFCIHNVDKMGVVHGEIVNRKFDKGRAVERVCSHLEIPIANSVAIGDSMNDKEMLAAAGFSICMENGSNELKKLADDICPSVQDDGIREAFIKHGLIQMP